ncbi:hypothetical protein CC78DRAFT_536472 [Lojkania enalia]|uniref:Uncharacterized protein n=1 Tax=Lojkania enalia TaxID=147567 RepID=A0A9P4N343_9PLEO|nr:hypothetical protein CC78DRAFT_536472 [Didymosphaeria enalia]
MSLRSHFAHAIVTLLAILQLLMYTADRGLNKSLEACYRRKPATGQSGSSRFCYIWLRHFHVGLIWRVCIIASFIGVIAWRRRLSL